jgi:hypothetical protein
MTIAGLWEENSQRGKALLALLGDEATRRRILGPDYDEVVAQIRGRRTGMKRPADAEMDVHSLAKRTKAAPS